MYAFAIKLLTSLESTSILDAFHNKSTFQYRSGLCAQALALVNCRFENNPEIKRIADESRVILNNLVKKYNKSPQEDLVLKFSFITDFFKKINPTYIYTGCGVYVLLALCSFLFLIIIESKEKKEIQFEHKEIFQLIADGTYGEARVRAESLPSDKLWMKNIKKNIIQAVNIAEQNEKDKVKKK